MKGSGPAARRRPGLWDLLARIDSRYRRDPDTILGWVSTILTADKRLDTWCHLSKLATRPFLHVTIQKHSARRQLVPLLSRGSAGSKRPRVDRTQQIGGLLTIIVFGGVVPRL